jgi:hypothetical protein
MSDQHILNYGTGNRRSRLPIAALAVALAAGIGIQAIWRARNAKSTGTRVTNPVLPVLVKNTGVNTRLASIAATAVFDPSSKDRNCRTADTFLLLKSVSQGPQPVFVCPASAPAQSLNLLGWSEWSKESPATQPLKDK